MLSKLPNLLSKMPHKRARQSPYKTVEDKQDKADELEFVRQVDVGNVILTAKNERVGEHTP